MKDNNLASIERICICKVDMLKQDSDYKITIKGKPYSLKLQLISNIHFDRFLVQQFFYKYERAKSALYIGKFVTVLLKTPKHFK